MKGYSVIIINKEGKEVEQGTFPTIGKARKEARRLASKLQAEPSASPLYMFEKEGLYIRVETVEVDTF